MTPSASTVHSRRAASRRLPGLVTAAAVATLLVACGSTGTATTPAAGGGASSATTTSATASGTVRVARASLGDVVVDASGMTLYMFTKDTKDSGKSSCAGQCLALWPPLLTDGRPTADGVSGTLATITTADGKKQVTLNGWPLYYYAKDKAAGDVTGQGVGQVWWVLSKEGQPVQAAAQTSAASGY